MFTKPSCGIKFGIFQSYENDLELVDENVDEIIAQPPAKQQRLDNENLKKIDKNQVEWLKLWSFN